MTVAGRADAFPLAFRAALTLAVVTTFRAMAGKTSCLLAFGYAIQNPAEIFDEPDGYRLSSEIHRFARTIVQLFSPFTIQLYKRNLLGCHTIKRR
jgi:hypothetical protein